MRSVSAATSRPSGPRASTRAEATITPSAPAFASADTWAGLLTPNPTPTGTGDTARTSRTRRPTCSAATTVPRSRRPMTRSRGTRRSAPRSPRDDRVASSGRRGRPRRGPRLGRLPRTVPFIRREVCHDDAGRACVRQAAGDRHAIAATDHLVRVAHRHHRQVGSGGTSRTMRRSDPSSSHRREARCSMHAAASPRRPAGRCTADRSRGGPRRRRPRERDLVAGLGVGIARHDVRDQRGSTCGARGRECGRDPTGAGRVIGA